jgi:hypothetical protein
MPATLADIRRFLTDHFSDQELTWTLCASTTSTEVFRDFTRGDMTTTRKGLALLLDYCQRRDRLPALLAVLERERPEPFGRVFGPPTGRRHRPPREPQHGHGR